MFLLTDGDLTKSFFSQISIHQPHGGMKAQTQVNHSSPGVQDCTVAWLCSHEIEFTAAKSLVDEEYEIALPVEFLDREKYYFGRTGQNIVVIAFDVPLLQLRYQFEAVRLVLLIGIGSGVPDLQNDTDIRLGDLVVSTFYVYSSLGKDFLHFKYTKQGLKWDESPIITEMPTTQLELGQKLETMRREHSPAKHLPRMARSRRAHIEQHVNRLNDGELDGSSWEPAYIRNSNTKYESTSIEVLEFEVIFARKEPENTGEEMSNHVVYNNSGRKYIEIGQNATQHLRLEPTVTLTAVPNQQAWQYAQDFSIWKAMDTMHWRSPDSQSAFVYPGLTKDILYCSTCGQPSNLLSKDCTSHLLRGYRMGRTCATHYGTTVVGNQVLIDADTRDMLRDQFGALCIEANTNIRANDAPHVLIRGVCDYGDSHQYVEWQPFAALAAAAYAKKLSSGVSLEKRQLEALGTSLTKFTTSSDDLSTVVDSDYSDEERQDKVGHMLSSNDGVRYEIDGKPIDKIPSVAKDVPSAVGLDQSGKEDWQHELERMLSTNNDMKVLLDERHIPIHKETIKERENDTPSPRFSDVQKEENNQQVQQTARDGPQLSMLKRGFSTRSTNVHAIRQRNRRLLPKSLDMDISKDAKFLTDWKASFGLLRRLSSREQAVLR